MTVTILDAWVEVDDYDGDGANFTPSAGSNRVAIIGVGAEENGGGGIGITSMTLGGQSCVKLNDGYVGSSTAYHNYVGLWYLNEAGIQAMSGNTISITWANFDGVGPFGTSPVVHYASYQDVDQANVNSATNINSNTSATTISPNAIDVAEGEKVIAMFVMGQPNTPSVEASMTEETEIIGGSNDMSSSCNHRTSTGADASYNPEFTSSSGTRLIATQVALGFDPGETEEWKDVALKVSVESEDTYKDIATKISVTSADIYKDITLKVSIKEFEIRAVAKTQAGALLPNAKCFLMKDNQDNTATYIGYDLSDGSGNYVISAPDDLPQYFTIFWKDDDPHIFDVTDHVLQPTEVS